MKRSLLEDIEEEIVVLVSGVRSLRLKLPDSPMWVSMREGGLGGTDYAGDAK